MAHDFAKQRAARNGQGKKSAPGPWLWLASGIVLGTLVSFLIYLTTVSPEPQPRPAEATEAATPKPAPRAKRTPAEPEKKPQFDFYEILPGGVSPGSQRPATDAAADAGLTATPAPSTAPAPVQVPEPTLPASPAQTLAASDKPVIAATQTAPALLLQAGSFRSSSDADRRRGEIILLGYDARIERSTRDGNTLYRVQIGPFASATAQSEARRTLQDLGIDVIEIGKSP
jgi:cell division protein FtsN